MMRPRGSSVLHLTQQHLAPQPACTPAAGASSLPPRPPHSVGISESARPSTRQSMSTPTRTNCATTRPALVNSSPNRVHVGLMGYGAIGVPVAAALLEGTHGMGDGTCPCHLAAVLVSTPRPRPPELPPSVVWTTDPDEFFAAEWKLCAEAAGQPAVVTHAERTIRSGRDLLVTSVGALTSDAFYGSLVTSASDSANGRLLVAAGAMPAVDWMASASMGVAADDLDVTCTQTKPPASWIGARYDRTTGDPAPDVIDFSSLQKPTVFFEGTAREAASNYPKNSNICAMLALATAGLDNTLVRLVADPTPPKRNLVSVAFRSPIGKLDVEVEGMQSANPRTGAVVPLTVLRAIKMRVAAVALGA